MNREHLKIGILGGLVGAGLVLLSGLVLPKSAEANPVPQIIKDYALGQATSFNGCVDTQSCVATSFSTTGNSTASKFTATVQGDGGSGNIGFAMSTGAVMDFGDGANDYCFSIGTGIVCRTGFTLLSSTGTQGTARIGTIIQDSPTSTGSGISINSIYPSDGGTIPSLHLGHTSTSPQNLKQIGFAFSNTAGMQFRAWEEGGGVQLKGTHDAGIPACVTGTPATTNGAEVSEGTIIYVKNDHDFWACDGTNWINLTP